MTPTPQWDDANSIDGSTFDWDQSNFEFLNIESSEFMTSVKEIEQITGSEGCGSAFWGDQGPLSPKLQIRNHDCMWSGTCGDQSHPGKFGGCGRSHGTGAVVEKEEAAQFNTVTAVAAASLNSQAKPILTPSNTINIGNNATPKINPIKAAQIPAGRSLLINPRVKQPQMSCVPTVSTADFLRERESSLPLHTRPDTPLSLDEDPPEFKHNIDLATCTIGSNRLSLTSSRHHSGIHSYDDASSNRIISMLKGQLEDPESRVMTSSSGDIGSLTDLLNDLEEIGAEEDSGHEELDSDTDDSSQIDGSGSRSRSSKGGGISGGYTHAHHQEMSPTSSSSSSSSSSSYEYQGTHVGDHSYTLPKKRYNPTELGVQTPSDSEEEIDVVSIGEKNLPTNPTPRDRRALQSRVAHKIARKQQAGVPGSGSGQHHHHHRRRHSDDDGYHHHQHGGYAGTGSHTTSPGKHAGLSPNYLTPAPSTTISGANTPLPVGMSSNPRKRPNKDDHRSSKNRGHHSSSSQHRSKKQRSSGSGSPSSSSSCSSSSGGSISGKQMKHISDSSEEQETLEKRNLHNDMERQRRIGLKNLFEELKRQIPNLREKERAPKVNILREAANLCNRLNREQEQLNALRKQQHKLYARVRQLRTSLHSQRRTMD